MTEMNDIIEMLNKLGFDGSLPYYACHYVLPTDEGGAILHIKNGALTYTANLLYSKYREFINECRRQLEQAYVVRFTWDGGKEHKVIFLPCTADSSGYMHATFTEDGTAYQYQFNPNVEQKHIVYCNFKFGYGEDERTTNRLLEVFSIEQPLLKQ